jgi:hypothetical protein
VTPTPDTQIEQTAASPPTAEAPVPPAVPPCACIAVLPVEDATPPAAKRTMEAVRSALAVRRGAIGACLGAVPEGARVWLRVAVEGERFILPDQCASAPQRTLDACVLGAMEHTAAPPTEGRVGICWSG